MARVAGSQGRRSEVNSSLSYRQIIAVRLFRSRNDGIFGWFLYRLARVVRLD